MLGDPNSEAYTLRLVVRHFARTADRISSDQIELAIISSWPRAPRMPYRYCRSIAAVELLVRSAIIRRLLGGRGTELPYRTVKQRPGIRASARLMNKAGRRRLLPRRLQRRRKWATPLFATKTSGRSPCGRSGKLKRAQATPVCTSLRISPRNATPSGPKTYLPALRSRCGQPDNSAYRK